MKTFINCNYIKLFICLLTIIFISTTVYAYQDYIHAKNLYETAINYIDQNNFRQGLNLLLQSYSISKNSIVSHALSYCYGMLGDYGKAKFYAKRALNEYPPLPADIYQDCKNVLNSNNNQLSNYFILGKYDGPSATSPRHTNDPCIYTNRVTDELPGQECPPGYAIKGITCKGSNCDDKYLKCCPTNYSFRYNEMFMTYWFSEEPPSAYSNKGCVIVGIWCRGRYCDDMMLKGIPVNNQATNCYWTRFFSEEGWNFGECSGNSFVSGITCSGGYCDNLSLMCCSR
jgi:tetratricopeptide (TPR) repeat protein